MTFLELPRTDNLTSKWAGVSHVPLIAIRRDERNGSAWSHPTAKKITSQPQDGAVTSLAQLVSISSHLHSNVLNEPEDARLTGGTRTLTRRLLGLNVTVPERKSASAVMHLEQGKIA